MTEVAEKLLEMGVVNEDVQTTGFNMWTEQVYGQDGPTGEVRYHLRNQVRATWIDWATSCRTCWTPAPTAFTT